MRVPLLLLAATLAWPGAALAQYDDEEPQEEAQPQTPKPAQARPDPRNKTWSAQPTPPPSQAEEEPEAPAPAASERPAPQPAAQPQEPQRQPSRPMSAPRPAAASHRPASPEDPPDPLPAWFKPVPNRIKTVEAVAAEHPRELHAACRGGDGEWEFLDALVAALRESDERWGYNCKRGNCSDPSKDVVAWYAGKGRPADGSPQVRLVDVIGDCGGAAPKAQWLVLPYHAKGAGWLSERP